MGDPKRDTRIRESLAGWVDGVRRRAGATLGLVLALSVACGFCVGDHLGVISDADRLFDESLPFRQLGLEFDRAFPTLNDSVIVVIDADSGESARAAARALARRVRAEPDRFAGVYTPNAGEFFERNGLLYLELDALDDLADQLATAQPFLAELSRDPSLRGVIDLLSRAIEDPASGSSVDLTRVLGQVEAAVSAATEGRVQRFTFEQFVLGEAEEENAARSFVFVQPRVDFGDFVPARAGLERLRALIRELGFEDGATRSGVRARMTGNLALSSDELRVVRRQAALAGLASFLLVGGILWLTLRSTRVVLAILLTLAIGLLLTTGFAALTVGHLNVISVAFGVLFIGLGVDFGIHFCLRYEEARALGRDHAGSLRESAAGVGSSLVLCAVTTATGFYAFVPTDYLGVAELGWIAGSGMLISLFCSLTVLPALLSLCISSRPPSVRRRRPESPLLNLPLRHPMRVCAFAGLAGAAALAVVPGLRFDANPLRVRDPNTESVQVFEELVAEGDVNPWSLEVLVADLATANAIAEQLESLPSVDLALTLGSYVPDDQDEKLEIVADSAFFLNLSAPGRADARPSLEQQLASLRALALALSSIGPRPAELSEPARRLTDALARALQPRGGEEAQRALVRRLEASLVAPILSRLGELRTALTAHRIDLATLPADLRARMLASDGRARVHVLPRRDLNDADAVARFVTEVRSVQPDVSGSSVYMLESGRTITRALVQAFATALLVVTLLLWALWRRVSDVVLVLAPLGLAAVLTAAVSVLVPVPINFADVIVLPLLLGIGVDSGIHLVHRQRSLPGRSLLSTSTPRAVLSSALTTIASFGSLAFSTHRGMSSLGLLLIVGVSFTLLSSLGLLPALVELRARYDRTGR